MQPDEDKELDSLLSLNTQINLAVLQETALTLAQAQNNAEILINIEIIQNQFNYLHEMQMHYHALKKDAKPYTRSLRSGDSLRCISKVFTTLYDVICNLPMETSFEENTIIEKSLAIIHCYNTLLGTPNDQGADDHREFNAYYDVNYALILKTIQTQSINCAHIASFLFHDKTRNLLADDHITLLLLNLITHIETLFDNDPSLADLDISFITKLSEASKWYEKNLMPLLLNLLETFKMAKVFDETTWATYFLKITEHFPQAESEHCKEIIDKPKCEAAITQVQSYLTLFLEQHPHLSIEFNHQDVCWFIDFGVEKTWSPSFLMKEKVGKAIQVKSEFDDAIEKIKHDHGGSMLVNQAVETAIQQQLKSDSGFVFA